MTHGIMKNNNLLTHATETWSKSRRQIDSSRVIEQKCTGRRPTKNAPTIKMRGGGERGDTELLG